MQVVYVEVHAIQVNKDTSTRTQQDSSDRRNKLISCALDCVLIHISYSVQCIRMLEYEGEYKMHVTYKE